MHIALDHQIFGLHGYSGISRYLYEIASRIAVLQQHRVTVVAPLFVNGYLRHAPPQLRVLGKAAPHFRGSGRLYRSINSMLTGPLLQHARPDIVHETYYSRCRHAPRTSRVVLTVHDMTHERLPHMFPPGDTTPADKAAAVARADHIICVSENTRRDLIELLGVAPERTSVVLHGFSLVADDAALPDEAAAGFPFFLYVGYRGSHKNFLPFLSAVAGSALLAREFGVICFGGGPFSPRERAAIEGLGIRPDRIRQLSGDDRVLASLYRQAVALVYPSLYEGFGIPPLEAMSQGCPVACSGTSSLPEVVGSAAITFDPNSTDDMRTAMERLVADGQLRDDLIRAGQERVKQFSWQCCAEETLTAYQLAVQ